MSNKKQIYVFYGDYIEYSSILRYFVNKFDRLHRKVFVSLDDGKIESDNIVMYLLKYPEMNMEKIQADEVIIDLSFYESNKYTISMEKSIKDITNNERSCVVKAINFNEFIE